MNNRYCLTCGEKISKFLRFNAKTCTDKCRMQLSRNRKANHKFWDDKRNTKQSEGNKMEEWKEIKPNIWKPEQPGDNITGVLISKDSDKGSFNSQSYAISNQNGEFLVWGSTVLDDRMSYIEVGSKIKIEFVGEEANKKGQMVKIYKVFVSKQAEKFV